MPPGLQLGPLAVEAYGSGLSGRFTSPVNVMGTYEPAPEGEVRQRP